MAGLLKDDFSTKRPITQVPAAWFNAVAKILNGITAGVGININKNGTDTAGWEFELDLEFAKKYLGFEDAEKPDDLTHEDITDWPDATADFLNGDAYDAIIEAIGDVADIVDGILADYLDSGDINVTVAAKNHTHTTQNIADWPEATADFLTDANMSNYALEADLLDLADAVEQINTDLVDLIDWAEQVNDDIYDESGNLNFVTTNTNQNITAVKNFSNSINIISASEKYLYVENTTTNGKCWLGNGTLWLNNGNNTIYFRDDNSRNRAWVSNITDEYLEFYHAKQGGVLKWDGNRLIFQNGSYLYDTTWGLGIKNNNHIQLDSPTDCVVMTNHPSAATYSTTSYSVPTVGWTELYFQRKANTSQDAHYYDFVKNVSWNGTSLVIQKSQMCVSYGSIVSINDYETPEYINTVTYRP